MSKAEQTIMGRLTIKLAWERKATDDWHNLPLVNACAQTDAWGNEQWFAGVCIEALPNDDYATIAFYNRYGNDGAGKWFIKRVLISEKTIKIYGEHVQKSKYAAQVRQWALEAAG